MTPMTRTRALSATCALLLLGLVGCGSSGKEELTQWVTEQRNSTRPQVRPLTPPGIFSPESYSQEDAVEPFSSEKLTQALKRDSNQSAANAGLIAPELSRRKEPLESTPLDNIVMVGSMTKAGKPVALISVDKLVYQVKVGNYLGQNYGRITSMTETELVLREIVQDSAGEWIERAATLQLLEGKK